VNRTWLIQGDALRLPLADASVQCVVTSPPYYALRDYGLAPARWPAVEYRPMPGLPPVVVPEMDACLGMEPTPEAFIGHLVAVFREVRRVLRGDGVCFVNLGDSYATGAGLCKKLGGGNGLQDAALHAGALPSVPPNRMPLPGLKAKDMIGIPWRFAFAAQADGWYLRQDIIWCKGNPMPESVRDRGTKAHEYLFLLAKSKRYFWDGEAVKEPGKTKELTPAEYAVALRDTSESWYARVNVGLREDGRKSENSKMCGRCPPGGRNARSVWHINPQAYPGAHFATFPIKLAERCILAGTSERGACPHCGSPWKRVVDKKPTGQIQKMADGGATHAGGHGSFHQDGREAGKSGQAVMASFTVGHVPTCQCPDNAPVPCVVLDPFGGSGTTCIAAMKNGRRGVMVECKAEYLAQARQRIAEWKPGTVKRAKPARRDQGMLFALPEGAEHVSSEH
jgi:DNA modification methylase